MTSTQPIYSTHPDHCCPSPRTASASTTHTTDAPSIPSATSYFEMDHRPAQVTAMPPAPAQDNSLLSYTHTMYMHTKRQMEVAARLARRKLKDQKGKDGGDESKRGA